MGEKHELTEDKSDIKEHLKMNMAKRIKLDYSEDDDEDASDIVLVFGDLEFHVHAGGLAEHSSVLKYMCQAHKDIGEEGPLNISDLDPRAVKAVIFAIYNGWYNDHGDNDPANPSSTLFNKQVYDIVCKWNIGHLKALALAYFEKSLNANWAKRSFCDVIEELYSSASTSNGPLRKKVAAVAAKNHQSLLRDHPRFLQIMIRYGSFGVDVLQAVNNASFRYECPKCKYIGSVDKFPDDKNTVACASCGKFLAKPSCTIKE